MEIMAYGFLVIGTIVVFLSKKIVKKYNLNNKTICEFENELTDEELENYKFNKAVVNLKMLGMMITLPGIILIFIIFK